MLLLNLAHGNCQEFASFMRIKLKHGGKKGKFTSSDRLPIPTRDHALYVTLSTKTYQHCTVSYRLNCIDFTLEVTVQLINKN